jgi:c-di-GMP-binding flagellar brake protein YcgR
VAVEAKALTIQIDEGVAPTGGRGGRTPVVLEIICAHGLVRVAANVREQISRDVLAVELEEEPRIVQRRDFVRAFSLLPALVEPIDGAEEAVEGTTIDFSGGGVRLRLPSHVFETGRAVRIAIELPGQQPVVALGRLARADGDSISIVFERFRSRERERLIAFVFSRLRLATRVA